MSIFVGNLPFRAEQEDIIELFASFGEVTNCSLPLERDTGRKRGFAFVEMVDEAINPNLTHPDFAGSTFLGFSRFEVDLVADCLVLCLDLQHLFLDERIQILFQPEYNQHHLHNIL